MTYIAGSYTFTRMDAQPPASPGLFAAEPEHYPTNEVHAVRLGEVRSLCGAPIRRTFPDMPFATAGEGLMQTVMHRCSTCEDLIAAKLESEN